MLTIILNSLRYAKAAAFAAATIAMTGLSSNAEAAVFISSGATANITCTSGVCTPTKKSAVLNITQLQSLLASGSVKVTTAGAKASDIVISTGFSWASANSLTLDAYQSITIEKPVAVDGTGAVSLVTNDGGTGGSLSFDKKGYVGFLSTANSLTINGTAYTLVSDISSLASNVAAAPGGHYALSTSYDASHDGTYAKSPVQTLFSGTFEGLGNTVTNLAISDLGIGDEIGLFEGTGTGSEIENLRLTKAKIRGGKNAIVGGLAATNSGLIRNDSEQGSVWQDGITRSARMSSTVGGLVGSNVGQILGCSTSGKVTGVPTVPYLKAFIWVGGLAGVNNGEIANSYSTAAIMGPQNSSIGGLVSQNLGSIDSSFATGDVTGTLSADAGGLVGTNAGAGTIGNSYATGAVETTGRGGAVGGLIGVNSGAILASYSTGSSSGGSFSGGVVGFENKSGSFTNSYWDMTTSGITNPSRGAGNINNVPGITGLSTTELQSGLPAGFSSSIWGESPSINGGLPYLLAIPPA
jgi:hypothetical protein